MARDAINLTQISNKTILPYSLFKAQLSEVTYKLWIGEWINQSTCRLSKKFLPYPCKGKSKDILKLSRSQIKRPKKTNKGSKQPKLYYVQNKINPGQKVNYSDSVKRKTKLLHT